MEGEVRDEQWMGDDWEVLGRAGQRGVTEIDCTERGELACCGAATAEPSAARVTVTLLSAAACYCCMLLSSLCDAVLPVAPLPGAPGSSREEQGEKAIWDPG